jgi:hypothetical protein
LYICSKQLLEQTTNYKLHESEEETNDLASAVYKAKRKLLKRKYNNRFRRRSSGPDSTLTADSDAARSSGPDSTPTADSDAGDGGQGGLATGPTPARGCCKHRHTGERPGARAHYYFFRREDRIFVFQPPQKNGKRATTKNKTESRLCPLCFPKKSTSPHRYLLSLPLFVYFPCLFISLVPCLFISLVCLFPLFHMGTWRMGTWAPGTWAPGDMGK